MRHAHAVFKHHLMENNWPGCTIVQNFSMISKLLDASIVLMPKSRSFLNKEKTRTMASLLLSRRLVRSISKKSLKFWYIWKHNILMMKWYKNVDGPIFYGLYRAAKALFFTSHVFRAFIQASNSSNSGKQLKNGWKEENGHDKNVPKKACGIWLKSFGWPATT